MLLITGRQLGHDTHTHTDVHDGPKRVRSLRDLCVDAENIDVFMFPGRRMVHVLLARVSQRIINHFSFTHSLLA